MKEFDCDIVVVLPLLTTSDDIRHVMIAWLTVNFCFRANFNCFLLLSIRGPGHHCIAVSVITGQTSANKIQ